MKLSNIIFYLGFFSVLSGMLGFMIWTSYSFLLLILLGLTFNVLSFILEEAEKLYLI